jgi:hypothetical protein
LHSPSKSCLLSARSETITNLPSLIPAWLGKVILATSLATLGSFSAIENVYALNLFGAPPPSLDVFDQVVRSIWEKQHELKAYDNFGELNNPLCINVLLYPAPDARSKAKMPLAWHLDYISDTSPTKEREKQIRQLEALVKVGLLKKSQVMSNVKDQARATTRYSLSEKGWLASGQNRNAGCLIFGKPSFLGVYRFEPKVMNGKAGPEVYEVHAKVGINTSANLPSWARYPDFQNEFSEIRKQLDGQEMVFWLVRDGGEWVDYQAMLQEEAQKKSNKLASAGKGITNLALDAKREFLKLNSPPPPTVEEIHTILQETHGTDQSPSSCIDLPGSAKLPVDLDLIGHNPQRYSVAIFTNKVRSIYDPVANKTIPYLNMLEQLGIVAKRRTTGIPGKGNDTGAQFEGYIYELTPTYAGRIHSFYTTCFPLGIPTVEFVDTKIAALDYNQMPVPAFRYKLKVLFKNPPQWMNDPSLRSKWTELDNVLEHGMACQGEFLFDSKTHQKYSGGGGCWWAFDSYYENY